MFGRRQSSATAGPPPRKNSIHASSASSLGFEKAPRSMSESFERRSLPVTSPRKLQRRNSMDLQPIPTAVENGVYLNQIIDNLSSRTSPSPTAPHLHKLVEERQIPVVFSSFPWMEHVIGIHAFVCADRIVLWNSQALNRALSLPESIRLDYPQEIGTLDAKRANIRVATIATEFSSSKVAIYAILFANNGSICLWQDVQASTTSPSTGFLGLNDSEHIVHVSGNSFPYYCATSEGRIFEITLEERRLNIRNLPAHANSSVFSGIFRLLSSKTPSPILVTKALPATSEMLVLHMDSTLERLAMTPNGLEDQWRFEMASFMYNYFSQHENEVLGYARCLSMPYATSTSFVLLIGFQAASSVVLYLFEFSATISDTPQFLRCLRLCQDAVLDMDQVESHVIDAQSLYIMTPQIVYAVSLTSGNGEMAFETLPVLSTSWRGVGGLAVHDTKSLVYLELASESVGDSNALQANLGCLTNYAWHVPAPLGVVPAPKRHKSDKRSLFSTSNVDEWSTVLLEQFQQSSYNLELQAKSDQSLQAFQRAVLALDSDILDAKPSTGFRWAQTQEDRDTHNVTPQLVKYQLEEKWNRHHTFISFLQTHPDNVMAWLSSNVLLVLQEHEEKLRTAITLCALQSNTTNSNVILDAMRQTVLDRGYTVEELEASGYSVFDMFYYDVTIIEDLFVHLAGDHSVAENLLVITNLLEAAHHYREQHFTATKSDATPWYAHATIRDSVRRVLQQVFTTWSDEYEADALLCIDLVVRTFVPAMEEDDDEKLLWKRTVLVPLVRVAGLRPSCITLVEALDFYEGMAYLDSTKSSLSNVRFAHFLFEWYAGEIVNPWTNDSQIQLQTLLNQPRALLPSLYTFLLNHSTLSKYAWIIGVQLGNYNDVATQVLHETKEELSSLSAKKTLASIGKLAAFADASTPDSKIVETFNAELLRIHIQQDVCSNDASVPMSASELVASCLESLSSDDIETDKLQHRVLMALDVVDTLGDDPKLLEECRGRVWQACIGRDAESWVQMCESFTTRVNDVAVEEQMKKLLFYSCAQQYRDKLAGATPELIDALLSGDGTLPADVNRTVARQVILKTLALAKA
ncbi:hypothetical protein THRCLA_04478 [Thraustotheca clavata]|uniref:Nuclear pore complex protein n=1 Tax=Thraustotheca clavata TaxID=74557 RepID=A0A1V9ZZ60_9STRA|nr:hypothetical protein THRCLA_04478 [Thraustotheca clavata]